MILNNLDMACTDEPVSIRISGDKIGEVSSYPLQKNHEAALSFKDAIVFPGLINSHEHLDFNLFPQLGNSTYNNYTVWGKHIHKTYKHEIDAVLKVPLALRAQWGVYKNLLCGVTTVVNHGERLDITDELINVFQDSHCLHSVRFEKWWWPLKLNNPLKKKMPVNMHVGEGDDWQAFIEIERLTGWNLLKRDIVGVHAVAMTEEQAKKFKAVVWCPESNYFLLGKTARINLLSNSTDILFGTDSTLTGSWDIWEHLRLARTTGLLSDDLLYQALNSKASKAWRLNKGAIALGKDADLVLARQKPGYSGYSSFFGLDASDILLVMHKGTVVLFDESLAEELRHIAGADFSKVYIKKKAKYVKGDLPRLMENIREYYPEATFPVTTEIGGIKPGTKGATPKTAVARKDTVV